MYIKTNKYIAVILTLFLGSTGLHFVYMGRSHEAKIRFLWFFFLNPIAFIKSFIDLYKIGRMNNYQFQAYCIKKIKGTGTPQELNSHINKLIKR